MLKRLLLVSVAAALVSGCGHADHSTATNPDVPGVAPSPNAPGAKWLALDAGARRDAVAACRTRAAGELGGAAAARAVRFPLTTLMARLQTYYATAAARLDSLPYACLNVLRQQVDAHVAITAPASPVRVGPSTRFLMIHGTVTRGAKVELTGGHEHDRPASVTRERFVGTVEVAPGRNDFVAEARFNGHIVRSRPLRVLRIGGRSDDDS